MVFPSVLDTSGKSLVWDSCQAHIVQDIKSFMNTSSTLSDVIPGVLTVYAQPGDIGIYNLLILVSRKNKGQLSLLVEEIQNHQKMKWCELGRNFWRSVELECYQIVGVRFGFQTYLKEWHLTR